MLISCPLCSSKENFLFSEDKRRAYLRCKKCLLVFVEDQYILSESDEKAIYDLHENDVNDQGYRKFLSRLAKPLNEFIPPGSSGLDFGCGPGPALAEMLKEDGHNMSLYDLYYHPNQSSLKQKYDFITSTEVVEHIRDSKELFENFDSLLKGNGVLGLMTKLVIDKDAFSNWHYKNDQTHIRFFSEGTFQWIAKKLGMKVNFFNKDVIIFEKQNS